MVVAVTVTKVVLQTVVGIAIESFAANKTTLKKMRKNFIFVFFNQRR